MGGDVVEPTLRTRNIFLWVFVCFYKKSDTFCNAWDIGCNFLAECIIVLLKVHAPGVVSMYRNLGQF